MDLLSRNIPISLIFWPRETRCCSTGMIVIPAVRKGSSMEDLDFAGAIM